jgi:quercetin 2,3-dioxygenase
MEIITVPLVGEMTHADSMGNRAVIRAGDVQRMSAGMGLTHSEYNLAKEPVHFYQIWIFPDERGLEPMYDQRRYDPEQWRNRLCPVASGQGLKDVVTFHTDATLYRAALEAGKTEEFKTGDTRRLYVYLTSGELQINRSQLGAGDQVRIDEVPELRLKARAACEFMLVDVPSCKGSRPTQPESPRLGFPQRP